MRPDGTAFAKYSPLEGFREIGPEQCGMGLHCCTASAPRALVMLPQIAVMVGRAGPVVNLYERGHATVTLASGQRVTLVQQTDYPAGDTVRIEVRPQAPARFALDLRIPGWSARTQLAVNDRPEPAPRAGGYARLERTWRPGDRVTLTLDLRARLVPAPDGSAHAAITRGPIVLARDARLGGGDVDEPGTPPADAAGIVPIKPAPAPSDAFFASYSVPYAHGLHDRKGELALCDYASAGNDWDPRSRFRVWIRQEVDPSRP
jgi:hypothetical protein